MAENSEDDKALIPVQPGAIDSWDGASLRGLQARREREKLIADVLKPGADFGIIPGTEKPTLLKPGAEKIADSLNLWPDYKVEAKVENFDVDKPLFFYRYRCILKTRGSDVAIASGLGSCNSMEARYRWRHANRVCPQCGKDAIIAGKPEFGGGWLCFKKKNGCGAKFIATDAAITKQQTGRVENDDIFSLVNTIDKMAQKRALVAASLNLGFSEHFTQDLEDGAHEGGYTETPQHKPSEKGWRVDEPDPREDAWNDPDAPLPEPDLPDDAQEPSLSKPKQSIAALLAPYSPKQRDALIRKYSRVVIDGQPDEEKVVDSYYRLMSPAISDRWAATTLGKMREALGAKSTGDKAKAGEV